MCGQSQTYHRLYVGLARKDFSSLCPISVVWCDVSVCSTTHSIAKSGNVILCQLFALHQALDPPIQGWYGLRVARRRQAMRLRRLSCINVHL